MLDVQRTMDPEIGVNQVTEQCEQSKAHNIVKFVALRGLWVSDSRQQALDLLSPA
jgi:hypothetical protein